MGLSGRGALVPGEFLRTAVFLALLAAPAFAEDYALPPPPTRDTVTYSADEAEYDADSSTVHLNGHVLILESTRTIKAQELSIDMNRRVGWSEHPLIVSDGANAAYGQSGQYDFANHTGTLDRARVGVSGWNINGKTVDLFEDRHMEARTADFTSCDYEPPHYHFHSSYMNLVPDDHIWARNAVLYVGDVPVFYTPFLYKSIAKDHWTAWKVSPGYDHRNGGYLKGTLLTAYSTSTYSKIYADYYSSQGLGYGAELQHHSGTDSRGALYAYRIHETSTGSDRWTMLGQGYQGFKSSTSLQGRFQLQSDPNFNNDYARSNFFRVTPDLTNNAALVRRFSNGLVRLSYSRFDVSNGITYQKSTEEAPRLDYASNPLRIAGLPWINNLSAFATNSFDATRPFLQKSVGTSWQGTKSIPLAKGLTLTPTAGISETYSNRVDELVAGPSTSTTLDAFVPRWSTSGDLRYKTYIGDIDLAHSYSMRLKSDEFSQDTSAIDKGVESNITTLSDRFMPARGVWARLSSGWDFRTFRDHAVAGEDRLQPIVAELAWQARKNLSVNAREDFALRQKDRNLILDSRWGADEGPALGLGFTHNLTEPQRDYVNGEFAIAPSSPTWRVSLLVYMYAETAGGFGNLHGGRIFDKELLWTRRWHDFYTKVSERIRTGNVFETQVRVELKFGPSDPREAPRRDWESEWFPERRTDDDLRP